MSISIERSLECEDIKLRQELMSRKFSTGASPSDAQSEPVTKTSREMSEPVVYCRATSASEALSNNTAVGRIQFVRHSLNYGFVELVWTPADSDG